VTKFEEVEEAIAWARSFKGPAVIEFVVEQEEAVYPMVPAGAALDQMLQRPIKA
jgi:acetolactate synthase-1/2/3 large subunit